MYDQTLINYVILLGFVGSIALICVAIFAGEFEGTIIGPGDDVKFGTLVINTQTEWWGLFIGQLILGIIDVYFYEYVEPYFNQVNNQPNIEILIENHGKPTVENKILLSLKSCAAFFPMMIRVTLGVLFVNAQIATVIVVQIIKEFFIFNQTWNKLESKDAAKMWVTKKEYDERQARIQKGYKPFKDDESSSDESSLKRRNNILF